MAFLTVMLLLLVLTVSGIAALTVAGLENRMAGYARIGEAAASAAESCLGTGVNVITQTLDQGNLPNALLDNAVPAGPVPMSNQTKLRQEIMNQAPADLMCPLRRQIWCSLYREIPNYTVNGDIDFFT